MINNLIVKFASDRAEYVAWIVPTIGCQSWPGPFTPWPKIDRVPPLITNNIHFKFESDLTKSVVFIMPTSFYTRCESWPWPLILRPKIKRGSCSHHPQLISLKVIELKLLRPQGFIYRVPKINRVLHIIKKLHVEFERDGLKMQSVLCP